MKSYRKEMWFNLPKRRGLVNITRDVQEAIDESGIQEGLCLVNPMHITASVIINDDEPGLHRDFERLLERLAPEKPYSQYEHNGFEDNGDAHCKRQLMGREVVSAVTEIEGKASIRGMGGDPTPDDLLKAADAIKRGAELAKKLQDMKLRYTEHYDR